MAVASSVSSILTLSDMLFFILEGISTSRVRVATPCSCPEFKPARPGKDCPTNYPALNPTSPPPLPPPPPSTTLLSSPPFAIQTSPTRWLPEDISSTGCAAVTTSDTSERTAIPPVSAVKLSKSSPKIPRPLKVCIHRFLPPSTDTDTPQHGGWKRSIGTSERKNKPGASNAKIPTAHPLAGASS